jgi:hypothetical protein
MTGAYRGVIRLVPVSQPTEWRVAMLKRTTIATVAALAIAGFSGVTLASENCTDQPKSKWLSQEGIAAKLKEQGFEVTRTETKRSCYEVKANDSNGRRFELYVDPATARVVRSESKDRS